MRTKIKNYVAARLEIEGAPPAELQLDTGRQ